MSSGTASRGLRSQLDAVRGLRGTEAERWFLISLGFVATISALHVINAVAIEGKLLNFSEDWNVPAFASAAIFAAAGAFCWRATERIGEGPVARVWRWIAVIMFALAVESLAGIHSRLEEVGELEKAVQLALPVAGLIVAAILARPLIGLAAPAPLLLITAAGLIVVSQVFGLIISVADPSGNPRDLLILLEESSEILAPCLVIAAAVDAAGLGAASPTASAD